MAENFVIEKFIVRLLGRVVAGAILIALVGYPLDWALWKARGADGGVGTMKVNRLTVAELKGGKEDYYLDGTTMVSCSRSLYPQGGNNPCWWLARHPDVIERY